MRAPLVLALVAAVTAIGASAAAAPWRAGRGTIAAGRAPRSYLVSSDAAPGRYSEGSMITTEPVALPYTLSAQWRRLGPEAGRSMHVFVIGAVILIRDESISLYAYDDTYFGDGDWRTLPGYRVHTEHAIAVHQTAEEIVVHIDGAEVARYALPVTRTDGHIGFGMKAGPAARTSLYVRDVVIVTGLTK